MDSSSKISVEYHDPSGVFPLVSRHIASRLPLRNLNWQSPSRPLRQIKSLHVEFVPNRYTQNTLRPQVHLTESDGPNSLDIVRSGKDVPKDAVRERRHQIPGLKTSPYLKIYVLRCDDKDAYKATERKRLREWIRETALPEGKRENHDAFEWLILHVVIPDTVAASEPRWRESASKDLEELKERKSGAKWPGKSTRTVFDKLRADFNESGKGSQDRVTQIRLLKKQVPPDLLPTPAIAETLEETPQERENSWQDTMNKLKTLILTPFDLRVRQYEADIAEQDARRSLPGWNFCTFFIHKEGLAKALESIGLVEDALVIYDELSLGLETVLRDMASGKADGTATSFAAYTDDIQERILDHAHTANGTDSSKHSKFLGLFGKDYREKIVRSQISVFDFFCYLFTRQKALILRLAGAQIARSELGKDFKEGGEDLVLLAEVCWRALSFVPNAARTLRQDLLNGDSSGESRTSQLSVESLVSSWTYSVAGQILDETYSLLLERNDQIVKAPNNVPNGDPRRDVFSFGMGADPYPQRLSSLPARKSAPELKSPPPGKPNEDGLVSPPPSPGTDVARTSGMIPGMPELTAYRAEMVSMRRKMLEQLAERRGWVAGLAAVRKARPARFEEVDLDDEAKDKSPPNGDDKHTAIQPSNLLCPPLAAALGSEEKFHAAFEELSELAIKYYMSATHTKSVEAVMGDLAMLKRQQGDLKSADAYFRHVLPLYATDGWSLMEAEALSIHAECLKELDRRHEYIRTLLALLAKVCGRRMQHKRPRMKLADAVDDDLFEVCGLLREVIEHSDSLPEAVTLPMTSYFDEIQLDHHIEHYADRDGFRYRLRFRHVLEDEIELDQCSIRVVDVHDARQEILLVSGAVELAPGKVEVELGTTATSCGPYLLHRIELEAKKLRFVHEMQPAPALEQTPLGISSAEESTDGNAVLKRPWLLLYPALHAFDAQMSLQRNIHIDRPRHIEIRLNSGWNEIQSIDLRLKPASAGLRLELADASYDGIEGRHDDEPRARQISLGSLETQSECLVKLPYTLEAPGRDIVVLLEAHYLTHKGSFVYTTSASLSNELPLDVDVDDIFHHDALISTFTVRTMHGIPLSINAAELDESPAYAVETPPVVAMPTTVFVNQPAKLSYKISRQPPREPKPSKREGALALRVQYWSIKELILFCLRAAFVRDLLESEFRDLSRLLLPVLTDRSRHMYSTQQMEMAALMNEATVPSFADLDWFEVTDTLPEGIQRSLTDWLMRWHIEHQSIMLDKQSPVEDALRWVVIPVEVPTVDIVFSAALTPERVEWKEVLGPSIRTLGQCINAQLCVRYTAGWSASSIYLTRGSKATRNQEDRKFVYEVQAEPDVWLIGGQRRAQFTLNGQEEVRFELLLVPLKLGCHSLPYVDVQPAADEGSTDGETRQGAISCETHYESGGHVVQVVRNQRTARVQILDSSAEAG